MYPWILEINKNDSSLTLMNIDMRENEEIFISQSEDPRFSDYKEIIIPSKSKYHKSFFSKIKNWFDYDLFKNYKYESYGDVSVKVTHYYDSESERDYYMFKIPVGDLNYKEAEQILKETISKFEIDQQTYENEKERK